MRKALEHAIRSTVIRSRAARYQTEIDTLAPKQATTAVIRCKQHPERLQHCAGHDAVSCRALLVSPTGLQLPRQTIDTELSSWGLLSTTGLESGHVSWLDDARRRSADSMSAQGTTNTVPTALTPPRIAEHEAVQYQVRSGSPGSSDTHDNVLFEGAWNEGTHDGNNSQEVIPDFQKQMESSLQSMQLELQRFKADVLKQLSSLQTADASRHGTRARSKKGSTRT